MYVSVGIILKLVASITVHTCISIRNDFSAYLITIDYDNRR